MWGRARTRSTHWRARQPCKRQSPRQERSHGDARDRQRNGSAAGTKPRSRIESNVRVDRLSDLLFPLRRPITPTKNIGARTRSINRQVGPDEQKCSLRRMMSEWCSSFHLAAGFIPRVHPHREQTCEGRNPMSAAGRQEGRTLPSGQAAEDREARVRNVACEKRPRRMTRLDPGRREPAPTDVVG